MHDHLAPRPGRTATVLGVLLCAGLPAQADTAWPAVKPDAEVRYRTLQRLADKLPPGSKRRPKIIEVRTEETHRVLEVAKTGAFSLSIERTRIWGKLDGGLFRKPVTFDTAPGQRIHPAAAALVAMLRGKEVVRFDARGTIQSMHKVAADGERTEKKEHDVDTGQFLFVQSPPGRFAVGTRWRPPVGIHECLDECVELDTRSEISAIDAKQVTVTTIAVHGGGEGKEPTTRIDRTAAISRRDGLATEIEAKAKTASGLGSRAVEQHATISMSRILPESRPTARRKSGKKGS